MSVLLVSISFTPHIGFSVLLKIAMNFCLVYNKIMIFYPRNLFLLSTEFQPEESK